MLGGNILEFLQSEYPTWVIYQGSFIDAFLTVINIIF